MENDMPYNVITGVLPECLQLDTISEILSSRLRKLPTGNYAVIPQTRKMECSFDDGKTKEKIIWHTGRKKRFLRRTAIKRKSFSLFLLNLF